MINTMHNTVDKYSMRIESALDISIPHEVKEDVKKWHVHHLQKQKLGRIYLKEEHTGVATDVVLTSCDCHH
eukprot:15088515-Ditylum_brightwellii.AAC.1